MLEKLERCAQARIAYKKSEPVGFIEYYSIDDAPLNVVGKDIGTIPCMNFKVDERGKGIGKNLFDYAQRTPKLREGRGGYTSN